MAENRYISARYLVLKVLNDFNIHKHNAAQLLHDKIDFTDNKSQATDLLFGTIRNRPLLDTIITTSSGRQINRINKKLINILRIAAYEIIFVPQSPLYAVVNEAVNLTHKVASKKHAGFVNAVLRKITTSIEERQIKPSNADSCKAVPTGITTGCRFRNDILPDPSLNPSEYLSSAFSIPVWLIDKWLNRFDFDKTKQICISSNRKPGLYVQSNTLKTSAEDLIETLIFEKIDCQLVTPDGNRQMIKIKTHHPVFELPGFQSGLFVVQDPTAVSVANTLNPQPGWTVLDLCAAPGTKTVQMAQLMNNKGKIIATDIDSARLQKVKENCERLGITIVEIAEYDKLADAIKTTKKIDAALLDVPCSNTGVLSRRPEVRLRINPDSVKSLAETQLEILNNLMAIIKNNITICYSTCSILDEENQDIINMFIDSNKNVVLKYEQLTLPFVSPDNSFDHDGGYVALIETK